MNWKTILLSLSIALVASQGFAGDDRHERREGRDGRKDFPPVTNAAYAKECGACHFAYQPGLLPARSWERIMNGLSDHFGTDASLDDATKAELTAYLREESAENSRSRRAMKFLDSIAPSEAPLRISETRYFKEKHREIKPSVYKRESIKSPAHCDKCHTEAARGNYSDDLVRIPKR